MRPRLFLACAALSIGSWTHAARADIAPSPPRDCPAGAQGEVSRYVGWCAATECATDADCPDRTDVQHGVSNRLQKVTYACQSAGLCIETRMLTDERRVPIRPDVDADIKKAPRQYAVKSCSDDSACATGVRCEMKKRCLEANRTFLDASAPDVVAAKGKCGCKVGAEKSTGAPWSMLVLPALVVLRRRSRRVDVGVS